MKAAVVESFEDPPSYRDFLAPIARAGEVAVLVRAAALSPLVKMIAAGKHYSGETALPLVPGVDGVGRLADGCRVYFAFPRAPYGSMAEQTVVPEAFIVELPDDVDDVTAAAIANPGMSSWAALTQRAKLQAGESVLVNGATGGAGRLAVQIAKHLGARRVVATGRTRASVEPLIALGADAVVALDKEPDALRDAFRQEVSRGVDVVLDYLCGSSVERFIEATAGHGSDAGERRVRLVQIGSLAGPTMSLPASALRSSGLEIMGSGLGSVPKVRLIDAIRGVMRAIVPAGLTVAADAVPLSEVASAWGSGTANRVVFTMGS